MIKNQKALDKYLASYTAPSVDLRQTRELLPSSVYSEAVIVPLYEESQFFFRLLDSLSIAAQKYKKKILLVCVLNHHHDSPDSVIQDNGQLLAKLKGLLTGIKYLTSFSRSMCGRLTHHFDIVLLDASSAATLLSPKKGVGLARKMAADFCLELYQCGKIKSPWLRSTDADVVVPEDYFDDQCTLCQSIAFKEGLGADIVAFTYPFYHERAGLNSFTQRASQYYDAYLKYYPEKLHQVASPYAFYALGSILMFHVHAYAQVRGFPERAAAEDFYFLNKLAKIGKIAPLSCAPLQISGRVSLRTPLGTGRSIAKISESLEVKNEYRVYHPDSFKNLKFFLALASDVLLKESSKSRDLLESRLLSITQKNSNMEIFVFQLLSEIEFIKTLEKINAGMQTPLQALHEFHCRFDGLKTLQFVKASCEYLFGYVGLGTGKIDI